MKQYLMMALVTSLGVFTALPGLAAPLSMADIIDDYGDLDTRLGIASTARKPVYLAQGSRSRPHQISASGGHTVRIAADYSFSSDISALFRPSRWRRPLRPGGIISWVNPRAWHREPYRTATVLMGEVLFIGISYGLYESFDSGSSGGSHQPPPEEETSPTTAESSSTTTQSSSSGESSSGGGSSAEPVVSGAGGVESPF